MVAGLRSALLGAESKVWIILPYFAEVFYLCRLPERMKTFIKQILQRVLGFDRYLYIFARYIIVTLRHNRKEGDFLHFLGLLNDGDTLLDIGANIGVMTVHMARRCPHSAIVAFEPMPCNVRTFQRIVQHYKLQGVTLVEKALGESTGEVNMILPTKGKVRMHGLSHVVHKSIHDFNHGEVHRAAMIRLDDYREADPLPRIGGIKIDVENYELFVLEGARETIQKHRPVIYLELWDNDNRLQCFDLIRSLGYKIMVWIDGQFVLYEKEKHTTQNFFFIP